MIFTKTALTTMDIDSLTEQVEQELRTHKSKYIFQGIGFIVSGFMAVALPSTTALNVELLIGVILLLTGVFQLVLTLKSKMHWWSLLSAGLSMAVGAFILWKPFPVLLAVVTVMAIFMTLEGFVAVSRLRIPSRPQLELDAVFRHCHTGHGGNPMDRISCIRRVLSGLGRGDKSNAVWSVAAYAGLENCILMSRGTPA